MRGILAKVVLGVGSLVLLPVDVVLVGLDLAIQAAKKRRGKG